VSVAIREFDGARDVQMSSDSYFVFLEAAGHCYAFDRALFLHGMKRALGESILSHPA
jgi:hypothetical protein